MVEHGHRSWHDLDAQRITLHVRSLAERGLEPSSIARHVATIRVFGRFLESVGHLDQNPADALVQPSTWQRLPDVLSPSRRGR